MIVGTAGHIDHGKTALVKALTGVDTDRLKEEKARGITIDLGFAYVPLPDGQVMGFVDVPGHERFVHTMLAGAAGIDFVVLVVAADDGVMPQTREHVAILDLLGLSEGIVALSKCDLVDADRIVAVEADIRALLARSRLAGADIYPVSAVTGAGIDALRERLNDEAQSRPPISTGGQFRMAIDRSFTLQGAGTVVTGTVIAGSVGIDDRVIVAPHGIEARVRSIHAQNRPAERAVKGTRCALNLAGGNVSKDAITRGDWLVTADAPAATARFDAQVRLLASEKRPLRTWAPVFLHVGTSALPARIVPLSDDVLTPASDGLAQVVMQTPLPLRFGDRFVLRDIAAEHTIGGGTVVDPRAPERRRRTPERLAALTAMTHADAMHALSGMIELPPHLVDLDSFAADRAMESADVDLLTEALELALIESGGRRHVTSTRAMNGVRQAMESVLTTYHAENPELPGMPAERARIALKPRLAKEAFAIVLAGLTASGAVVQEAGLLRLPSHTLSLAPADARLWEAVRGRLEQEPMKPPTAREIAVSLGQPIANVRRLCKTLGRMGQLVEVATDRFFMRQTLVELGRIASDLAAESPDKSFTAAQFKDRAGSGRNIGIQVLEYFDRSRLTIRIGDVRRIARDPSEHLSRRGSGA